MNYENAIKRLSAELQLHQMVTINSDSKEAVEGTRVNIVQPVVCDEISILQNIINQ